MRYYNNVDNQCCLVKYFYCVLCLQYCTVGVQKRILRNRSIHSVTTSIKLLGIQYFDTILLWYPKFFIECHGVTFDDDWCELFLSKQDTIRFESRMSVLTRPNKNCFWKTRTHSNIQISQFELPEMEHKTMNNREKRNGTTRLKIEIQLSLPNLAHRSHSPLSINHRLSQKSDLENHNRLRHEWNHPNTSTK